MFADLPWNNPLHEAVVAHLVARLELRPGRRLLDVGCGRGELLARALATPGTTAVGIDPDQGELARARDRLAGVADRVELHARPVAEVELPERGFDAALCLGATHAFGERRAGLPATLDALIPRLRPGGVVAVADGYWRRPPEPGYLAATGMGPDDYRTHAANLALGTERGLRATFVAVASLADWDRFEDAHESGTLRRVAEHPEDEAAAARAEHVRTWCAAYRRWGRDTLGFGLYVYASAGSSPTASA